MTYLIYIIFGIIPSIAWLLYYLRKDAHPESRQMILKVFFYGMMAALPVALIEIGFLEQLKIMNIYSSVLASFLYLFIGVALIEEFVKYLVVRGKVIRSASFDEPIDAMLYMIIAALGFAAVENILILFSLGPTFVLGDTVMITAFRFLGATFLHTLCSGLIGFFLALSICFSKKRGRFLLLGLFLATLLHGFYNFSIIELEGGLRTLTPIIILIALAIFVTISFKKLKKLKSICKI